MRGVRMKLIIDISNELAEKGHWYNDEELWTVIKAAQNGTPIDDDSLLAALMLFAMNNVTPQSKAQIKEKLLQILERSKEQTE